MKVIEFLGEVPVWINADELGGALEHYTHTYCAQYSEIIFKRRINGVQEIDQNAV
jgi:hypothetical protein